jgi:hypothetical protein
MRKRRGGFVSIGQAKKRQRIKERDSKQEEEHGKKTQVTQGKKKTRPWCCFLPGSHSLGGLFVFFPYS